MDTFFEGLTFGAEIRTTKLSLEPRQTSLTVPSRPSVKLPLDRSLGSIGGLDRY